MTETILTAYLGRGTHAARPAAPDLAPGSIGIYFETDTGETFVWNGSNWTGFAGGIDELTGDVTAGPGVGAQVATLSDTGVVAGPYVSANITIDAKGRIIDAEDGASGIDELTGDVTAGPGAGSQPATLAASGVAAGVYTYASIEVDAKGRVIDASSSPAPPAAAITELTGDVTAGPGSGSQAATLAASGVTAGTYFAANITVDAKGRITTAASSGAAGAGEFAAVMSATPTKAGTGFTTDGDAAYVTPTKTDGATGISISAGSNTSRIGLYTLRKAAPSGGTKTCTARLALNWNRANADCWALFGYTDGTKYQAMMIAAQATGVGPVLYVATFSDTTHQAGTQFTSGNINRMELVMWLQVQDDGTNIKFRISTDGATYTEILSIVKSSGYLGSGGYSNIFFGLNPYSSNGSATLMSYTET